MSARAAASRIRNHPLVRATVGVAGLTLVVKIAAMAKEMLVASRVGVSREMDAFTLAFGVVGFFVMLFAGSLGGALVPAYVRASTQAGPAAARALLAAVTVRLFLALTLLALLLGASIPLWLPVLAPRWRPEDLTLLAKIVAILLPWLPIAGTSMVVASALNGERRFGAPALIPVLTVMTIMTCLFVTGSHSGAVIAAAVSFGAVLELIALSAVLGRADSGAPAPPGVLETALIDVRKQYLPAVAAGLLMNSTPLIDMWVAGMLPAGAVSALAYAGKIPAVVISLSGGALGTTTLPAFSRLAAAEDWGGLRRLVTRGIALTFASGVVIALLVAVFSPLLVRLLYQRGAFSPDQVETVSDIQILYAIQIPFYLSGIIVVRLISALRRNHILFWGTVLNATLNVTLDLLFLPTLGVRGIALSTSIVLMSAFCFLSFFGHRTLRLLEQGTGPIATS
jgi:putative peptidoglycan lipid II flippase